MPFALIIRRVGREAQSSISAGELRATVRALYTMYALEFRDKDMKGLFDELDRYPSEDVKLVAQPNL